MVAFESFIYLVEAMIALTPEEILHIRDQALKHHDLSLQNLAKPGVGAFIHSWVLELGDPVSPSVNVFLTSGRIDTCLKILEVPDSKKDLAAQLVQIRSKIREETDRLYQLRASS